MASWSSKGRKSPKTPCDATSDGSGERTVTTTSNIVAGTGNFMSASGLVSMYGLSRDSRHPFVSAYSSDLLFDVNIDVPIGDPDADGFSRTDNCTLVHNPTQCDTNADGYGNHCDPDLNDNEVVNFDDLADMKAAFFSAPGAGHWNPHADLNCNEVVNFVDLGTMQPFMFGPPGPSAQR